MIKTFDVVVATDRSLGIGKSGQLPWKLPEDMKHFQSLTSQCDLDQGKNAVIMGRRTWESIPVKRRPLANRINVVLTRDPSFAAAPGVLTAGSLEQALEDLQLLRPYRCFIIGGGEIYRQAVKHPACRHLYITQIEADFQCDTFFPEYENDFVLLSASAEHQDNGVSYSFRIFGRGNDAAKGL